MTWRPGPVLNRWSRHWGRHVATISEFVVVADVEDKTVTIRSRYGGLDLVGRMCGITQAVICPTLTTCAAAVTLWVLKVAGITKRPCHDSLWRMAFVGTPVIFRFDEVVRGRGCIAAGSVASVGRTVFFLAQDGFYSFDGQGLQPIGTERINRHFRLTMNPCQLDQMSVAVDLKIRLSAGHSVCGQQLA